MALGQQPLPRVPAAVPLPTPPQSRAAANRPVQAAAALPQETAPQSKVADTKPGDAKQLDATIKPEWIELPPRDKIFVMYSDAQLEQIIMNRIRLEEQKAKRVPNEASLVFPPVEPVGGGVAYKSKTASYPPSKAYHEPLYLIHRRLHFEEKNAERYGWDLGFIQPLVSAAYFYKDILLWPNHLASGCAYGFWDTNAGKCLPGSPTPYMLYPPGLTITGTAAEGAVITGAAFIFP